MTDLKQMKLDLLTSLQVDTHANHSASLDLKKALDEGEITEDEFELMKEKIIKDDYAKEIIKSTKEEIKKEVI